MGQFDKCFPDVSSMNTSVDKIIVHPDFSPGNRANDIALIKLSTPLNIERRVSPICLAVPSKYFSKICRLLVRLGLFIINKSSASRQLKLPLL